MPNKLEISPKNCDRIDKIISNELSLSRSHVQSIIKNSMVKVNSITVVRPSYLVSEKDVVEVFVEEKIDKFEPSKIEYDILYDDEYLLVINKPAGIVTHAGAGNQTNTLVHGLVYDEINLSNLAGEDRLGIVHRLDKDTSGCLIIAKDNETHNKLKTMFFNREVEKYYYALVNGVVKEDTGVWDCNIMRNPKNRTKMAVVSIGGKQALSHFKVVKRYTSHTLLMIKIITGRTHQIRVQCQWKNCPIVGDKLYNTSNKTKLQSHLLHAYKLSFIHPITSQNIVVEAPLPDYFNSYLENLK